MASGRHAASQRRRRCPPQEHRPRRLRLLPGLHRQRGGRPGGPLRDAGLRGQQARGAGAEAGAAERVVVAQVGSGRPRCALGSGPWPLLGVAGRLCPAWPAPLRLHPAACREQLAREGSAEPGDSCGSDGSAGGGGSGEGADEAAAGTRHRQLLEWVGGLVSVGVCVWVGGRGEGGGQ
jgi:hypothetical protein